MKTAISVDDELMAQADQAARDLGLSRSALISEALKGYLRERRRASLTERLNLAYADEPSPAERQLVRQFRTKVAALDRW